MATETQVGEITNPSQAETRPSPQGPPPEKEISLLDLLIVLAERRFIIFLITAVFAITAIVVSLLLPKRFTATTTLLPPQQNTSLSSVLASQLGSLGSMAALAGAGGLSLKNPNDMYVAMFRSERVEDAMIKDFNLKSEYHARLMLEARKAFESNSKVKANDKDNLIEVSVTDPNPARAAAMANRYVDEFHHLTEHLAITEAGQRRIFFQQQLEDAKNKLADAEEALKKTQQKTGLIQLDSQARALIESAASLRAQIAAKEVQIHAMNTYATGENAQMVQAQQELDSLRAQLKALGGSESNPDSLIVPKGKVPEAGLEYLRKLRDVKYYEAIFDILARQFEMAKLDEAREGAVVQVVDSATVPERRSSPKRALIVIISTAVGFFLGLGAALAHAGLASLKSDPEAAAKLALLRNTFRRRKAHVS